MRNELRHRRLSAPVLAGAARQRGAAAIFAAIGLVAALAAAGFAIDLGRIYTAQRDLQRLANVAALDVMTGASGCDVQQRDRLSLSTSLSQASISRNGGDPAWLTDGGSLRLGRERSRDGLRRFEATANPATAVAVEIVLQRPFPQRLLNLPGLDSAAPMRVVAAAKRAPLVTLTVNSAAPELTADVLPFYNALLGGPGGPAGQTLATLQPLVDAAAPVQEILPAIFGNEIIDGGETPPTDVPSLLGAIAAALFGTADEAAAMIQEIASSSDGLNEVIPGDVITVPPDYDQVGQATVPAFELVRNTLQAAGDQIIALFPGSTIPGVLDPDILIQFEQPGRVILSPDEDSEDFVSEARSAAVSLRLRTGIGTALGEPLQLVLEMDVAPSTARVAGIRCASRDRAQNGTSIDVVTGAAELRIPDDQPLFRREVSLGPGGSPLLFPVQFEIYARSAIRAVDQTRRRLDFDGPFPAPQTGELAAQNSQVVGGSAARGLDNAMYALAEEMRLEVRTNIDSLDTPLRGALEVVADRYFRDTIEPAIRNALLPALLEIDDQLLLPALEAAGARVPATRITVYDVRVPRPVLFAQR